MLPHAGSANDEGGEGGEEEEEEGGDGKDTEEIFEAASAQAAELDRWSVGLIGLALLSGDGGVYRLQEAASPVADLASAFVQALAQPTPAALRSRGRAAGLGEEGTDRGGRQLEASCGGADPSPPGRGCRRVGACFRSWAAAPCRLWCARLAAFFGRCTVETTLILGCMCCH